MTKVRSRAVDAVEFVKSIHSDVSQYMHKHPSHKPVRVNRWDDKQEVEMRFNPDD